MRIAVSLLAVAAVVALTGCAGPEQKFGRGMNNLTEIARGGEMRRSIEQTTLWDGPTQGATTGWARGFTRTMARTGIGLYEVVTFPLPPYRPVMVQKGPLYPDPSVATRKPTWGGLELPETPARPASESVRFPDNGTFDTDDQLGFSGGAIGFGNRFSVFE